MLLYRLKIKKRVRKEKRRRKINEEKSIKP
jgi:hypothetical protein